MPLAISRAARDLSSLRRGGQALPPSDDAALACRQSYSERVSSSITISPYDPSVILAAWKAAMLGCCSRDRMPTCVQGESASEGQIWSTEQGG